jgi:hypothetical protein
MKHFHSMNEGPGSKPGLFFVGFLAFLGGSNAKTTDKKSNFIALLVGT